ncbi:MAG: response regulator [Proteobacteria bacterium]|nr:response regulator [Pseudomonadota bacterium]
MATERAPGPLFVLATTGRDSQVICDILGTAGIACEPLEDVRDPGLDLGRGSGLIVAQETLDRIETQALEAWLARQPPWSDFPIIFLRTRNAPVTLGSQAAIARLGNVTILERPLHPTTLLSAARSAVRARARQREAEVAADTLERRVDERTGELAAANRQLLAEMVEREKVEATVMRMQRLEAVGQLTAGVAHDFNNLLTVVLGNLSRLEKQAQPDDKKRLEMMRIAAERGAKLTGQLLAFSRRQKLEPKAVNLNEAIGGLEDLLRSTIGGGVALETHLARDLWAAQVDPTQIEMVILNLAINARDATPMGGKIHVETSNARLRRPRTRPEDPEPGDYVVLCVRDTGSGMDADTVARVFEPFFTTKGVGRGSGLGLPQVLGFAKQSGGGVRLQTRPGEGTTVRVYLPRAKAAPVAVPSLVAERLRATHPGAVILLVDDDNAVRETTAGMLKDLGFSVLQAGSGGAALDILDRGGRIDLMLLDFAMPGMTGAEVARAAASKRPGLPVLFVTGYADLAAITHVDEHHVIRKPFEERELANRVADALAEGGATIGGG